MVQGRLCNYWIHNLLWQILASVLAKVNGLYVMIYERNDSLGISLGPGIAFQLHSVIRTESEHENLLSSCHVTRLMAALQPALIDGLSRTTAKSTHLGLWTLNVDAEI